MIISIWNYRKYIWENARRDLWHQYAGSAIGFFWNVISPLFQILLYTLVFSKIMQIKIPNLHAGFGFAIYLCSGLIPWLAFSDTLTLCTESFIMNANYLRNLAIPEQVFVAQNAGTSFMKLMISMAFLVVICSVLGHTPAWSWLSLPLLMILLQGFGFSLGLLLGVLNAFFRDISQALSLLTQLWFWATPIVYTVDILPASFQKWLWLNPAYPFIRALHTVIVDKDWPSGVVWSQMLCLTFASASLGYLVLRRLRPQIRDVL
jgi:ABC-type polysaccharide/polyol phosphate export permease